MKNSKGTRAASMEILDAFRRDSRLASPAIVAVAVEAMIVEAMAARDVIAMPRRTPNRDRHAIEQIGDDAAITRYALARRNTNEALTDVCNSPSSESAGPLGQSHAQKDRK